MARPISSRWPRPYQRCPTRKITIYGWSTSRVLLSLGRHRRRGGPGEAIASVVLELVFEPALEAKRLVITTGTKKGRHLSPATAMRMLREHGGKASRRRA